MIKKVVWGVVFIIAAALLQSTVMSRLPLYIHAIPDIALIILVYTAYVNGTMTGQLTGFISGFMVDFLSSAPLGLNAFIRTLSGALAGFFKGMFYLDYIFLPMALCAGATIFKAVIILLLNLLFPEDIPRYSIFSLVIWVELGLNTVLAPFVFGLLRLASPLLIGRREKA